MIKKIYLSKKIKYDSRKLMMRIFFKLKVKELSTFVLKPFCDKKIDSYQKYKQKKSQYYNFNT